MLTTNTMKSNMVPTCRFLERTDLSPSGSTGSPMICTGTLLTYRQRRPTLQQQRQKQQLQQQKQHNLHLSLSINGSAEHGAELITPCLQDMYVLHGM